MKLLSFPLAGCLLFSLVSITLMESFLALSFVFWVIVLVQKKEKFAVPGFFWPLVAYAGLSLAACSFSVNPEMSLKDARELLLYLIVPIAMSGTAATTGRARTTLALLASGYLSIIYSLGYYAFKAQPGERVQGFMGHYMTQAGLLLLFLCAAMSFFAFREAFGDGAPEGLSSFFMRAIRGPVRWLWAAAIPLAGACLALTLTRSAWIGLIVAAAFILILWKPKSLILLPLAVALVFLLSPQPVKRRALSIFSLESSSNRQRIQYIKAGVQIIRERPVFGTGPDT
ncbi:MAG: O-antigen ligase family protein, partial [Clostridiales bacterium]|nr:O-antigen ligase family protein [Clostridiales bacterium]